MPYPDIELIERRYATEKYKRLWYPTRPLITIIIAAGVLSLVWFGVLTLLPALLITFFFTLDDVVATPFLSVYTAINNIVEERKQLKAIVMLVAIGLALILGGIAGWYVMVHMPVIAKFVGDFFTMLQISPILLSSSGLLGCGLAPLTKKMNATAGFGLGLFIAFFIPVQLPLMIEAVFLAMLVCAYVASVVTKQILRAYYKSQYGHSNADGYKMAGSATEQAAYTHQRAIQLGVSPQALMQLTDQCKQKIFEIKRDATVWEEYISARTCKTNSYKDVLDVLMSDKQSIENVRAMLENSRAFEGELSVEDSNAISHSLMTGVYPEMRVRDLIHQLKVQEGGGIEENLLRPFMS